MPYSHHYLGRSIAIRFESKPQPELKLLSELSAFGEQD